MTQSICIHTHPYENGYKREMEATDLNKVKEGQENMEHVSRSNKINFSVKVTDCYKKKTTMKHSRCLRCF